MANKVLALMVAVTLGGCAIPLRGGDNPPTLERKIVTQKVMPDTLVAFDGTRCTPTRGKFHKTTLNQNAWCIWLVPRRPGNTVTPQR